MTIYQGDVTAAGLVAAGAVEDELVASSDNLDLAEYRRRVLGEVLTAARERIGSQLRLAPIHRQSGMPRQLSVAGVLFDGRPPDPGEGGFSLEALLARGHSLATLRYFALTAHYRAPWNFSWTGLAGAQCALEALLRSFRVPDAQTRIVSTIGERLRQSFDRALADDLDTSAALVSVWDAARAGLPVAERLALVLDFDRVLGLGLAAKLSQSAGELPPGAESLIQQRATARHEKDWARSDELRERLGALGVETRDSAAGSTYHRRSGRSE